MGIRFYCPNGHKLNVKEFQAGMKGICPVCGTKVQIPVESTRKSSREEWGDAGRRGSASAAAPQTPSTTEGPSAAEVDVAGDPPVVAAAEPSNPSAIGAAPAKVDSLGLPGQPPSEAGDPLAEAGDAVWYVRPASGGQFGPAGGEVMRTWIDEGRVSGECLVWREGWRDWQEASQVFAQLGNGWNPSALDQIVADEPSARTVGYRRPRLRQRPQTSQAAVILLLIFAVIVLAGVFVWVLKRAPEAGTSQLDDTATVASVIRFPVSFQPACLTTRGQFQSVCHCFAEAVQVATRRHCLPCGKQWHILARNAGQMAMHRIRGIPVPPPLVGRRLEGSG